MQDDTARLLRALEIDRSGADWQRRPRRRVWPVLVTVSALAGAGMGAYLAWGSAPPRSTVEAAKPAAMAEHPPQPPAETRPTPVQGAAPPAVAAARPAGSLVASGFIVARRMATVSAEITGRVEEVRVQEGVSVAAGDLLARLDDRLARIDLDLARAKVTAAAAAIDSTAADLRDAERTLTRTTALSGNRVASDADLIRAKARAESLRAQLQAARAELEAARLTVARNVEAVDRHLVRAPFAGVVTEKNAQPGEIISPMSSGGFTRTGICTLVDMDSLEIEVDVNEANIGRVSPEQPVQAVLDAYPDWTIPASVIAVIPTANRDKATIKVRIALGLRDARILPNMAAKVTFLDAARTARSTP